MGTNADYQKMAFIGASHPDLLMSDSTNSEVETMSISERVVGKEVLEIMRNHPKNRMIVATFASNVYRVAQIMEAAVNVIEKSSSLDAAWKTLSRLVVRWEPLKSRIPKC